jgi:hypothetical protein
VEAPADIGEFSHALLVGNFRGGTIAAFNPRTGRFMGNVLDAAGSAINIDGGKGGASGPSSTLFFTAGPDSETKVWSQYLVRYSSVYQLEGKGRSGDRPAGAEPVSGL